MLSETRSARARFLALLAVFLTAAVLLVAPVSAFAAEDALDGASIGEKRESEAPLRIAVLSDVHVPYAAVDGAEGHVQTDPETGKVSYFNSLDGTQAAVFGRVLERLSSDGFNTVLAVGDYTRSGKQAEYDLYLQTVRESAGNMEVIEAIGNHEMGSTNPATRKALRERWRENMGTGVYFDQWVDGAHVWALGSDADVVSGLGAGNGFLSHEQLDWLEAGLDRDMATGTLSVVLCHWPADGTWPANSNADDKETTYFDGDGVGARLRELVSSQPNAVMFSGHTHVAPTTGGKLRVRRDNEASGVFVHDGCLMAATPSWAVLEQVPSADASEHRYRVSYGRLGASDVAKSFEWAWTDTQAKAAAKPAPELSVRKMQFPESGSKVAPGDVLRYRVEVENIGDVRATSVGLYDWARPGTMLVAGSYSCSSGRIAADSDGLLSCIVDVLDPGETAWMEFEASVDFGWTGTVRSRALLVAPALPTGSYTQADIEAGRVSFEEGW